MTIKQDGKDPLVYLKWDKVSSYSIDVHGSCKGKSTGMCGTWDDDDSNDMTGPDGKVLGRYTFEREVNNFSNIELNWFDMGYRDIFLKFLR